MQTLKITRNANIPLRLRKKLGMHIKPKSGQTFAIDMFGQTYHGETGSHMDNKIWVYGLHEASTVRLMRSLLLKQKENNQRTVYLDVGTNAGMHLLACADLCDQAFGFEPWEKVRNKAHKNIKENQMDHITLYDFGLSDTDSILPFKEPDNNNLGVGMFVADQKESTTTLEVRNGDALLIEHDIHPTLIKMDIEGHEKKALGGLKKTLLNHKPDVVFEYSDGSRQDLSKPGVLEELFGSDYKFYGIKRSREKPSLETFNPAKKYENVLATVNL